MSIVLTDRAVAHVRRQLAADGEGVGLRLGVKTSGCSGFAYTVSLADRVTDNDQVFEQAGVSLVVDGKSLPFLDGMVVDFVREGLNQKFTFNNPNVKAQCGCGESFSV